ncbi:MAG TPA: hypothetical protein VLX92_19640 [Kofleriaceae bacterium]|nr:hypothetical protein [Kofleriaceae bacterium]
MPEVSLAAIRLVRARVEVSIADARAALLATGGDVEAAVCRLITSEQAARDRNAEYTERRRSEMDAGVVAPVSRASRAATTVTMETSAARIISEEAPELAAFLRAVPATCCIVAFEHAWNQLADGASQLVASADFHSPDPERDRARTAAALAKEADPCLCVAIACDELQRVVIRISATQRSTVAAARTLQGPNLAAFAAMLDRNAGEGAGAPLDVRRRCVFALPGPDELLSSREGILVPDESCYEEAIFRNPGNADRIRVLDHDGVVSVDVIRR